MIHLAALNGHADVVKLLIQNGADVNAVTGNIHAQSTGSKWTPILFASNKGHVDVAKALVQGGADVNVTTTPLYGTKMTPLHFAVDKGNVDLAKVLIQGGADVNSRNYLYGATCRGHVPLMLLLICCGATIKNIFLNDRSISWNRRELLREIKEKVSLLRQGKHIGANLMSDEENRFMWNLAFSFTVKYRSAAFKSYYAIRSFITHHGIFMAP